LQFADLAFGVLQENMAPPEFLFSACICCYDSIDLEKILILGRGEQTFICIEEKFCCAANDTPLPVGMVKEDGFICKLGLYCCTAGLKKPDTKNLISGVSHMLCFKSVAQFPFGDKGAFAPSPSFPCVTIAHLRDCARAPRASAVGKPVCAICAFSIMPEQGCMKPPPGGGAPPAAIEMAR
jgi:hypothetical protein